jgi:hypothetical protein
MRSAVAPGLLALLLVSVVSIGVAGKKRAEDPVQIRAFDVALGQGLVFVGGTAGLSAFEVEDPTEPRVVGQLDLPGSVRGVTLQGERAFLAVGSHGLYVVDITDPTHPSVLGRYDPPGPVESVLVRGSTAFLAEDRDGLSVVDLTHPDRPKRLARITSRGQLRAMALEGDRLATAEGAGAVRVFDVSTPARPKKQVELRSANGARDVAFLDGYLLVAAGHDGLLVYDLERPRAPLAVAAPLSSAVAVQVSGHLALVCNGGAGLQILDLTDVRNPTQAGSFKLPHGFSVTRVAVEGDRLYIAAGQGDLAVAEMADPAAPRVLHPRERTMQIRLR